MIPEAGAVLDLGIKASSILKTLSEALRQKNPDLSSIRVQVSELEQVIDTLRSDKFELHRQLIQTESENATLRQKIASDQEWKTRSTEVEEFIAPGGAVVFRRKNASIYYCPICYEKKLLISLQRRGSGYYVCQNCTNHSGYQIESSGDRVYQRHPPRNMGHGFSDG